MSHYDYTDLKKPLPIKWTAPEILLGGTQTHKSDSNNKKKPIKTTNNMNTQHNKNSLGIWSCNLGIFDLWKRTLSWN